MKSPTEFNQPIWLDYALSPADVAAIIQGGCASGAYMPAVTYHKALATMDMHGDEIFDFLESVAGEVPKPADIESWDSLAMFYVSRAVEYFSWNFSHLADWENEEPFRV